MRVSESGGSKSGNIGDTRRELSPAPPLLAPSIDPELAIVVAAWPTLPPAICAGIIAMVKAAKLAAPRRTTPDYQFDVLNQ
jgi:hypothetical protein